MATSRINTLRELHDAGLNAYLFISPIFPGITDFKALIEKTYSFADIYLFENLNIRANNRSAINAFIKKFLPDKSEFYYILNPSCYYWENLKMQIRDYCNSREIEYRIYFSHAEERKNQ